MVVAQHLAAVVVHKDVAGAVISQVRDLHAVGVPNLFRLEGCIDGVHFNHRLRFLCLQFNDKAQQTEGGKSFDLIHLFLTVFTAVNLKAKTSAWFQMAASDFPKVHPSCRRMG